MKKTLLQRFEEKFVRGGADECWEWLASIRKADGYGQIYCDGIPQLTHRISYALYKGEIPSGCRVIMHSCDNRKCVNPKHLIAGSHQQNTLDALNKGRLISPFGNGEKHVSAKLSDEQARSILYDQRPTKEIAKELGVHYDTVWAIKTGKSWRHLAHTD